jgi:signal transduction histidine kinase
MWRDRVHDNLFPGVAERDEGFRRELERVSIQALRIIGAVQIGVSLFMVAVRFLLSPGMAALYLRGRQAVPIIGLGLLNLALARLSGIGRWARLLAGLSALATASILVWASMIAISRSTNPNDFIPGQITLVLLVAVATVPLRPMQTLTLGLAIGFDYLFSAIIAERTLLGAEGPDDNYMLFIVMLTLLCTAVSAVLYAQRQSNYRILLQTVEAGEALRQAQTRIVMMESASSLNRLAAAVSHEMNTPVGALLSALDTLLLLAQKQASSGPAEREHLIQLQAQVRTSIQESAQRLKELVGRMQRFTNLDQAEVQEADVNDVLKDVTALIPADAGKKVEIALDLHSLPPIVCRPQQLSVAFSSVLNNAVGAVDGDGRVRISTRQNGNEMEIEIADNGRGVSAADLPDIFDPGFRVANGRVAAGNWSLFSSRQIVREHGGDIRIASVEGKGTTVTISLPVRDPQVNQVAI